MKLTYENKREIIRLREEEYLSLDNIAKLFNVAKTTIADLLKRYEYHGEKSVIKIQRNRFTSQEKIIAVKRIESGESQSQMAVELNIERSVIREWVKKYEEKGYNGLISKQSKERPHSMNHKQNKNSQNQSDLEKKLQELEKQNKHLEMENEFLKKLDA